MQPDVLFISRAREHRVTDKNVQGAPDLVIEILSPSTADRDLEDKHELYGRHGVLEYWIIDPVAETVAVHRQRDGKLERTGRFGRGESLATAVFEGLALELDDISPRTTGRPSIPVDSGFGVSGTCSVSSSVRAGGRFRGYAALLNEPIGSVETKLTERTCRVETRLGASSRPCAEGTAGSRRATAGGARYRPRARSRTCSCVSGLRGWRLRHMGLRTR